MLAAQAPEGRGAAQRGAGGALEQAQHRGGAAGARGWRWRRGCLRAGATGGGRGAALGQRVARGLGADAAVEGSLGGGGPGAG